MLFPVVEAPPLSQKRPLIVMMPEDEAFIPWQRLTSWGIPQHFVDLIEDGEIPFQKVGTHRRVYVRDLKKYSERRDKSRRETMNSLFDKVSQKPVNTIAAIPEMNTDHKVLLDAFIWGKFGVCDHYIYKVKGNHHG